MKKILSSFALVALATTSYSADLPRRKSVPAAMIAPAPVASWTGFYAGVNLGGASISNSTPAMSGLFAGVQAGYDWQFDQLVVGLAADLSKTNVRGSSVLGTLGETYTNSITSRLGYAVNPQTLLYVNGGVAYGNFKEVNYALATSTDRSASGLVLGLGGEYKIDRNWSTFGEYRRLALKNNVLGTSNENNFRVGANYRF